MKHVERGSTLVIASLMLLVLLGLAASMTFTAQSQSNLSSAVKLQQFYDAAALSPFNRVRANLADYWVTPDPDTSNNDAQWRFGKLLQDAAAKSDTTWGNFPEEDALGNSWGDRFGHVQSMNSGMMDLTFKVWISNNPDDPAFSMVGMDLDTDSASELLVTEDWDLDGKIVLTVEVFAPNDAENPVARQSALIGVVGSDSVLLHGDAVSESDESDVGGQGTGTLGDYERIEIGSLED